MARRNRDQKVYRYKCTITEEEFKVSAKAPNPSELISVRAFYEMNPEEDDRPEAVVKKLGELPDHSEPEEDPFAALTEPAEDSE